MLGKLGILITILALVLLFFIVISFGAGAFSKDMIKPETKKSIDKRLEFIYSEDSINIPYMYLTIKSIIAHCSKSFKICIIDDNSFEKIQT